MFAFIRVALITVSLHSNKTQTKIPSVVAGTINRNTQEVEAGLSLRLRTTWSIERVLLQPRLHSEAPPQTNKNPKMLSFTLPQKLTLVYS